MSKTPTDDELAKWFAEQHGVEPPDDMLPGMRRAIAARSLDAATKVLLDENWDQIAGNEQDDVRNDALALRRRFPQPITDEVLREAGFEPSLQPGRDWVQKCGQMMLVARRPEGSLWWVEVDDEPGWWDCPTPDRLHRVVECLRGLYGEEE